MPEDPEVLVVPGAARLRRGTVGALMPLALVLAACHGEDPGDPSASRPTSRVPERFSQLLAAASRQATTVRLSVHSSGGAVRLSGRGDVDATTSSPSADMTMSVAALGGAGIELRLVDEVLYLRVPHLSGGKFFAFDVRDPDDPLGQELADQLDPRNQLGAIGRGVRKVVRVGSEVRDGERLDVYQLSVETAEVRGSLGPDAASQEAELPEELTYVVAFDERRRLRRLTIERGGELGTVEMRFEDWGKAVDIQQPAGDLVDPPVSAAGMAG